ncbi:Hsp20 family protein [Algihabitans albus]|uniref:Hsp20 family protein n=1 Tax=Algihabitans albus TaxID=2164067 RepID=UPI000E5D003E|nr:Hsp20 family protein [Algihabitans albus]
MRTTDFSPLLRATVGFDRMMNLLDTASRVDESALNYPPYNIEKTGDDAYRITMAVAGFGDDDLNVTLHENQLTIEGKKGRDEAEGQGERPRFLHRGIATRAFQRSFQLADHIRVSGARLENGLLHVELLREVPESAKPRSIAIQAVANGRGTKVLENEAA